MEILEFILSRPSEFFLSITALIISLIGGIHTAKKATIAENQFLLATDAHKHTLTAKKLELIKEAFKLRDTFINARDQANKSLIASEYVFNDTYRRHQTNLDAIDIPMEIEAVIEHLYERVATSEELIHKIKNIKLPDESEDLIQIAFDIQEYQAGADREHQQQIDRLDTIKRKYFNATSKRIPGV